MSHFLVTWFMLWCIILARGQQCPSHQQAAMKLTITSERNSTGYWIARVTENSSFVYDRQYTVFHHKQQIDLLLAQKRRVPFINFLFFYSTSFLFFHLNLINLLLLPFVLVASTNYFLLSIHFSSLLSSLFCICSSLTFLLFCAPFPPSFSSSFPFVPYLKARVYGWPSFSCKFASS